MSDTDLPHRYDMRVVALAISAGHSYWFHSHDPTDGVGPHPTLTPDVVDVVAGQGVVGDRFFGVTGRLASAVSFGAAEAVDAVAVALGRVPGSLDPVLMRRTVVTEGVDLNALRHGHFAITSSGTGDRIEFTAGGETSPCAWMDAVLAPGARDLLRGRGGLRATPTTSGRLAVGPAVLESAVALDPARAGDPVRRRGRLP